MNYKIHKAKPGTVFRRKADGIVFGTRVIIRENSCSIEDYEEVEETMDESKADREAASAKIKAEIDAKIAKIKANREARLPKIKANREAVVAKRNAHVEFLKARDHRTNPHMRTNKLKNN